MMRTTKTPIFAVGDHVAYSVQFLRNIGMSHSAMAHGRGTVVGIENPTPTWTLVQIAWKNANLPDKVNAENLAKVGLNTRFSQC
jgi:hypothetical protein